MFLPDSVPDAFHGLVCSAPWRRHGRHLRTGWIRGGIFIRVQCTPCCMTDVTISARIPKELEKEVERLMREEYLEKSAALRRLLHLGLKSYRLEKALAN